MQRRIVGIGEALLTERGGEVTPGGLAVDVARWAARCGHIGIPISRLGQDQRAQQITTALRELNIDTSHLQSDPDLPTARRVVQMIAGRETSRPARLDERAAFDNLQWDFDLVDVAQETDATVFGMTAQRGGLSESVIRRFLSECSTALRVFDLTNRAADDFDRTQALRNMELADIVIIDPPAARVLLRRSEMPDVSDPRLVSQIRSLGECAMVVTVGDDSSAVLHAGESVASASSTWSADVHPAMRIALLHSQLRGDECARAAALIDRITEHARRTPETDIPESLLE